MLASKPALHGGDECAPDCKPAFSPALVHRYGFDDEGDIATDSIEHAGAELHQTGCAAMTCCCRATGSASACPTGLLSQLESATTEAWVTWRGGVAGQRIFDIGNSAAGESLSDRIGSTMRMDHCA